MDRNSAIGFTLIALIIVVYFTWFSSPVQPPQKPVNKTQSAAQANKPAETKQAVPDSVLRSTYGDMSSLMKGEAANTTIETEDLKLTFSSQGGKIIGAELKKYKTYDQRPLNLITASTNIFELRSTYQKNTIDLYSLYYQAKQEQQGDTTVVTFTANAGAAGSITHTYRIPKNGYEIAYSISAPTFIKELTTDNLTFYWQNTLKPVEKDLKDTRDHSTIVYYTEDGDYDFLNMTSTELKSEKLSKPVKWISIKEKFFLSAFIAKQAFAGGEVQTVVDVNDSSSVKIATVSLQIPRKSVEEGKANFKFYLGPNDYQKIGDVAEDFAKNVYLGWKPIYYINKFVIFPVFHFLTKFISNYGLIIFILVVLLKLVLFPLSYKSYLSMAKMKVLKPELEEIKARVGDDMAKVQQEQLKLYQQVGVNPISGCVPVLLQMPILFAMFYLFPNSIELRQQSFLWAEDLSTFDSLIHVPKSLPFLNGHISLFTVMMTLATLVYTWQNNQISSVTGPMKSMSYIMPIVFLFVLNNFPAGLTFYYFVSTMITFGQQAIIRSFVDENKIKAIMEENRKRNAAGGGPKKSKFMSKLEDAMKAGEEARRKQEEERKKRKS